MPNFLADDHLRRVLLFSALTDCLFMCDSTILLLPYNLRRVLLFSALIKLPLVMLMFPGKLPMQRRS